MRGFLPYRGNTIIYYIADMLIAVQPWGEIVTLMCALKNICIPKTSQFSLYIVFQILALIIMFKSLLVEIISYFLICISLNEIKQIFFCSVFYLHTLPVVLLGFWLFFFKQICTTNIVFYMKYSLFNICEFLYAFVYMSKLKYRFMLLVYK